MATLTTLCRCVLLDDLLVGLRGDIQCLDLLLSLAFLFLTTTLTLVTLLAALLLLFAHRRGVLTPPLGRLSRLRLTAITALFVTGLTIFAVATILTLAAFTAFATITAIALATFTTLTTFTTRILTAGATLLWRAVFFTQARCFLLRCGFLLRRIAGEEAFQ